MAEQLNLDELERIGKAATQTDGLKLTCYGHGGGRMFIDGEAGQRKLVADFYHPEDREFYFAARNNWQALIDRIRELEARPSITRSYERPPLVIDEE